MYYFCGELIWMYGIKYERRREYSRESYMFFLYILKYDIVLISVGQSIVYFVEIEQEKKWDRSKELLCVFYIQLGNKENR